MQLQKDTGVKAEAQRNEEGKISKTMSEVEVNARPVEMFSKNEDSEGVNEAQSSWSKRSLFFITRLCNIFRKNTCPLAPRWNMHTVTNMLRKCWLVSMAKTTLGISYEQFNNTADNPDARLTYQMKGNQKTVHAVRTFSWKKMRQLQDSKRSNKRGSSLTCCSICITNLCWRCLIWSCPIHFFAR